MLTRIYLISFFLFVAFSASAEVSPNVPSDTSDIHPDVSAACLKISNKLASVDLAECLKYDMQTSGATSVNKLPLLLKVYPPLLHRQPPQARILMLGGIHGDEYSSITIIFKWMQILDKYHSGLFHWKIAPLVNPDGLLQKKSQRMNANGVDLNRNFPNNSSENASLIYWAEHNYKDPRRYPGKAPLSELETKWIVKLIADFKPDVIVAVHAPYGIVDFDGPPKPPSHLGSLHLKLLGTYPGSLGNYAGLQQNIPVVTVELPYAGIMPNKNEVSRIWVDLIRWLKKNVPQKHEVVVESAEEKLKSKSKEKENANERK